MLKCWLSSSGRSISGPTETAARLQSLGISPVCSCSFQCVLSWALNSRQYMVTFRNIFFKNCFQKQDAFHNDSQAQGGPSLSHQKWQVEVQPLRKIACDSFLSQLARGRKRGKQLVNLKCVWNGLSNLFGFIKSHYKHYNIITSQASVPGHQQSTLSVEPISLHGAKGRHLLFIKQNGSQGQFFNQLGWALMIKIGLRIVISDMLE